MKLPSTPAMMIGAAALASLLSAQASDTARPAASHTAAYPDLQSCTPVQRAQATENHHARKAHFALLINADGMIQDSKLTKSSGDHEFDQAALDALKTCTFHPATVFGTAQASWLTLSYPQAPAQPD